MASDERALRATAIIPAAGRGVRMGGERKQYRTLGDRPLLLQTASAIGRCGRISQIVLVVPPGDESHVTQMISQAALVPEVIVVGGGETRTASVWNGISAAPADADIVLIHDAVRPFIGAGEVNAVLDAADQYGAASLAIPVADTLRQSDQEWFGDALDRRGIVRVQTPQAFRRSVLVHAFEQLAGTGKSATDESTLVMAAGVRVRRVQGSSFNFKLTTREDWELARMLWPSWIQAVTDAG